MSRSAKLRINFDVPPWFNDRIIKCAKAKGWTKAEFIRRAIEVAMDAALPSMPAPSVTELLMPHGSLFCMPEVEPATPPDGKGTT